MVGTAAEVEILVEETAAEAGNFAEEIGARMSNYVAVFDVGRAAQVADKGHMEVVVTDGPVEL